MSAKLFVARSDFSRFVLRGGMSVKDISKRSGKSQVRIVDSGIIIPNKPSKKILDWS